MARLLSAALLAVVLQLAATINPGTELVVHYCCPDLALFNTTSGTCDTRQTDAEWLPPWTHRNGSRMAIGPGTVYTLIMGYPSCAAFLYRPDKSPLEDDFLALPSGDLYFPYYNATVPADESCIVEVAGAPNRLHFAVVCMDSIKLPGPKREGATSHQHIRSWLYPSTMVISQVCIVLTLITYWLLPELRDLQGKTIIGVLVALFFAYLMFMIVNGASSSLGSGLCLGFGLFLHYWMLASFFWLSVVSLTVYYTTRRWGSLTEQEERRWFIYLSVFGWCAPLVFTLAAIIVDFSPSTSEYLIRPHIASRSCWFGNRNAELAYFFGPITVLLVANVVLFIMSAFNIYKTMGGAQKLDADGEHKGKNRLIMCFKLFFVMGITWVFEVLQFFINQNESYWIIFDMINMLQGLFIFIAVVLSEKRVRQKLTEKLGELGCWRRTKATEITRLDEEVGQNRPKGEEVF
ncbi:G-protein coupled receptor Mth2-like [Amphibalanus amphitrite]|uniref:G-protein coupled receptor Mth2-like n=1 Tax=Amphibalanus amphitrite TaxID=1232801 RepID=UPI001C928F25|nr:G-protein coupled receptor Mth2-like [Amphibalanus amphitrite]XP_043188234.1 G-protein coupled receptor Mth2-like [Amphibalanus amphitrite]XP_043236525.1 G-protein coupled receptor Mth2-like [Amphibalanus amphitrite]